MKTESSSILFNILPNPAHWGSSIKTRSLTLSNEFELHLTPSQAVTILFLNLPPSTLDQTVWTDQIKLLNVKPHPCRGIYCHMQIKLHSEIPLMCFIVCTEPCNKLDDKSLWKFWTTCKMCNKTTFECITPPLSNALLVPKLFSKCCKFLQRLILVLADASTCEHGCSYLNQFGTITCQLAHVVQLFFSINMNLQKAPFPYLFVIWTYGDKF